MKFTRTQAIFACTLIAGMVSAPAFGQSYGLIARGDCPKAMRMMSQPHSTPAPSYKPVAELERLVAELQAQAPDARDRAQSKRAKRLPSRF